MSAFSQELKKARAALGHRTARSFFDWLKGKGVSFNYSYYSQLEKSGVPSASVAQELAAVLKGEWSDRILLAYCRSIFPKNAYLFPETVEKAPESAEAAAPYAPVGQKELTLRQVAVIASSQAHYHLFLLATLARKPVRVSELGRWFKGKELAAITRDLTKAGLLREGNGELEAVSVESRFPEAYNKELKEAYARFDLWDEKFGDQFELEPLLNKMQIRRVSGRYLTIIRHQLDVLFELVRSADETDLRFNDKVLQLKVVMKRGSLPG